MKILLFLTIAVLSGCTNVTNIERDRWSWDPLVKTYNLDEPLGARDYWEREEILRKYD
mgnify:CR=1 FL=1